jgi:toxin-antitoxin system PIN domain toxin
MSTSESLALLDTNILVYAADEAAAFHESAKRLRDRGIAGEVPLVVSPQVLMEFFAVITNPRRVEHPRSPEEAQIEVEKYLQAAAIRKIHPGTDIIERVLDLLRGHPEITRQEIFDCHLAATMLTNNITQIYTYNEDDFRRFPGIEVVTP